jgi:hypothetical protein
MAGLPLSLRVLILRMMAALAGAFLLCAGTIALCSELSVGQTQTDVALFCVLSSQMTWATLAPHSHWHWLMRPRFHIVG